ncbi:MAG: hypothetical protein IT457_01790 [Planctomycetes bacterium]|nr:hypothetical protein [Planctomycetota bacterium]
MTSPRHQRAAAVFGLWLCGALVSPLASQETRAELLPAPEGWTARVRTELLANIVVRARIRLADPTAFEQTVQRGGGYVAVTVQVLERLKGRVANELELTCYVAGPGQERGVRPTKDELISAITREVFLMLDMVGQRWFLADRYTGEAMVPDVHDSGRELRALVRRHKELERRAIPDDAPFVAEVDAILDELADYPERQLDGFQRLQELGPSALPAIVRHIEDERLVPGRLVRIRPLLPPATENPAGPKPIELRAENFGDVMAALANEWTTESFGADREMLGRRSRERRAQCLRVFAHYLLADRALLAELRRDEPPRR